MNDLYEGKYQNITLQGIINTSTSKIGNGIENLVDDNVILLILIVINILAI